MLLFTTLILACGGGSEPASQADPTPPTDQTAPAEGTADTVAAHHCGEGETVALSCPLNERGKDVLSVCTKGDEHTVRLGPPGEPSIVSKGDVKLVDQSPGETMHSRSYSFSLGDDSWAVSDQDFGDGRQIEATLRKKDGSSVSWLCDASNEVPKGLPPAFPEEPTAKEGEAEAKPAPKTETPE